MGEKWLYEVRIIQCIVVLPIAIFPGGKWEGDHSLTVTTISQPRRNMPNIYMYQIRCKLLTRSKQDVCVTIPENVLRLDE